MNNLNCNIRQEPAEWAGLLEHSQTVLAVPNPSYRALLRLVRHAERLPGAALEHNYNYGLGKIMCRMAERLQVPEERRRLIGTTALSMVDAALQWRSSKIPMDRPFVPVVGDLLALVQRTQPSLELARKSWADLPPDEQLLTDTLTTARALRHAAATRRRHAPMRMISRVLNSITLQVDRAAATVVAQNTFTGAGPVLSTYLLGISPDIRPSRSQLASPIDSEKVAALLHPKYFAPPALLRLDEFKAGSGWKGEGDSIAFDRSIFKAPPPEPVTGWPLSAERHGCPALFTGGLALDVALNILPQAIELSRQLVPGEHFQVSQARY